MIDLPVKEFCMISLDQLFTLINENFDASFVKRSPQIFMLLDNKELLDKWNILVPFIKAPKVIENWSNGTNYDIIFLLECILGYLITNNLIPSNEAYILYKEI